VLEILWGEETVADVLQKRGSTKETAGAGDAVGAVISELGMPRSLQEVGVGEREVGCLR
jgi:hypothetical protein